MNKTITWSKLIDILRNNQPILRGDYGIIDYIVPEDGEDLSLFFNIDGEEMTTIIPLSKNENIVTDKNCIFPATEDDEETLVMIFETRPMNLVD